MSQPNQVDPPQQTDTPPVNNPGNNQPPQQPPNSGQGQRPQVNVHTDNTPVLDAVNSLPEKLGDVVKELFQTVKPPDQPQQPQQQQQPPQTPQTPPPPQQQQQPTPQQPVGQKPGRVASWFFGLGKQS
jgi:hypothetical protein